MDAKIRRLDRDNAILMVCDIQDKFTPLLYGKDGLIEAASMMIRAARVFNIPIIITQHVKKTMGQTCQELKKHLDEQNDFFIQKSQFSMVTPEIQAVLNQHSERKQIILIGAQTHVCILQTFLDLKEKNYDIYLIADAITSIRSWERKIAFKRMESEGGIITTFESTVFELLRDSKDERFKPILAIIKESKRQKAINHL